MCNDGPEKGPWSIKTKSYFFLGAAFFAGFLADGFAAFLATGFLGLAAFFADFDFSAFFLGVAFFAKDFAVFFLGLLGVLAFLLEGLGFAAFFFGFTSALASLKLPEAPIPFT